MVQRSRRPSGGDMEITARCTGNCRRQAAGAPRMEMVEYQDHGMIRCRIVICERTMSNGMDAKKRSLGQRIWKVMLWKRADGSGQRRGTRQQVMAGSRQAAPAMISGQKKEASLTDREQRRYGG